MSATPIEITKASLNTTGLQGFYNFTEDDYSIRLYRAVFTSTCPDEYCYPTYHFKNNALADLFDKRWMTLN